MDIGLLCTFLGFADFDLAAFELAGFDLADYRGYCALASNPGPAIYLNQLCNNKKPATKAGFSTRKPLWL
ncbi:hypothetical protein [Collimonas antrihumi]|uniref:hypothetical protein n=1 Tax=Collimonas antrihumi TaxID=1940615 RepID=UPI001B8B1986|nr:hypothetical protein [Collimonas antrihumi]